MPTLMNVMRYLPSRSVLVSQSFNHHQLAYFATLLIYRVFSKIWSKGNNALIPLDQVPPTSSPNISISMWEYATTILYAIVFVRFIRIIYWVLTMWIISILPLYKDIKESPSNFWYESHKLWSKFVIFHSYCLLLIITQCSFLIYSLCSFATIAMPFNFQPTIFSAQKQYNRSCKYSRSRVLNIKKQSNITNYLKYGKEQL